MCLLYILYPTFARKIRKETSYALGQFGQRTELIQGAEGENFLKSAFSHSSAMNFTGGRIIKEFHAQSDCRFFGQNEILYSSMKTRIAVWVDDY